MEKYRSSSVFIIYYVEINLCHVSGIHVPCLPQSTGSVGVLFQIRSGVFIVGVYHLIPVSRFEYPVTDPLRMDEFQRVTFGNGLCYVRIRVDNQIVGNSVRIGSIFSRVTSSSDSLPFSITTTGWWEYQVRGVVGTHPTSVIMTFFVVTN